MSANVRAGVSSGLADFPSIIQKGLTMQANWVTVQGEVTIRSGAGETGEQVATVVRQLVTEVTKGVEVDVLSHSICRTPDGPAGTYLVTVVARQWREIDLEDR